MNEQMYLHQPFIYYQCQERQVRTSKESRCRVGVTSVNDPISSRSGGQVNNALSIIQLKQSKHFKAYKWTNFPQTSLDQLIINAENKNKNTIYKNLSSTQTEKN